MDFPVIRRRHMIVPTLRYNDARQAIDWLCRTFGFERHLVVEGDDGRIEHAQLTYGSGMVMLGQASDSRPDRGGEVYVVVSDPDAHCRRARDEGAEIVREVTNQDYGGRLYSVRDLEGKFWHFGSYDPFDKSNGRIDYHEDDAASLVEIRIAGRVTADRFEQVVEKLEAFLARHEKVRIVEIVESFEGMDLSLLFDDFLFSLRHMRRFSHIAVVTDLGWVERMTNAAAVIMPAKIRVFPMESVEEARSWLRKTT
ncbi:MAG: STAS/SEC14 domain-containing protein [Geminicoccaceae bacterium]|nr:STAS/SEC14 domain-containing protein [Geminicoccaceae bacterium]